MSRHNRHRRARRARAAITPPTLDPRIATLIEMLTYGRPAGSSTERSFRVRYLLNLPGAWTDMHHNIHVTIGDKSPIVWSAHTDTVHRADGRQDVRYDPSDGLIKLARRSARISSCLGADDTAGCFMLREMILAGTPGHYIFHYGEERGGIGSGALSRVSPELLDGATIAIAVDRAGTDDVITHQAAGRCCSDVFAASLARALNARGDLFYLGCDRGIYTDTAEYTGLVRECTNLSVGYEHAHSPSETLDPAHVLRLIAALNAIDVADLEIARNVTDPADDYFTGRYFDDDDWTIGRTDYTRPGNVRTYATPHRRDWWTRNNHTPGHIIDAADLDRDRPAGASQLAYRDDAAADDDQRLYGDWSRQPLLDRLRRWYRQ